MAYLAKGRKQDLQKLAEELRLAVTPDLKILDLKNLITKSPEYDEEFSKALLESIIEDRLEETRSIEKAEEARLKAEETRAREKNAEREFELEKLRLEAKIQGGPQIDLPMTVPKPQIDIRKLVPKFDPDQSDVSLYLVIFERQAKRAKIEKSDWVSSLLGLMPLDIVQLIAREPDEKADDFEHVKQMLLKRFKLRPETFRQKFVQHQKGSGDTWKDFVFEVRNYLEEWLSGLEVKDFESLKDLMIVDQIKKRVKSEVKEHFIDEWADIKTSSALADLLDKYDSIRGFKKYSSPVNKVNKDVSGNFQAKSRNFQEGSRNFQQGRNDNIQTKNRNFQGTRVQYQGRAARPQSDVSPKVEAEGKKRLQCYSCGSFEHLRNSCPKLGKRQSPAAVNNVEVQSSVCDETSHDKGETVERPPVLTAKVTVPVTKPIEPQKNIDKLKIVNLKCGNNTISGIVDSGAQISVIRADLVADAPNEGEGRIKIVSAFGEMELAPLKIIRMKINDGRHGEIPVTCAVSEKLTSDMLISISAFDALNENVELYGSGGRQAVVSQIMEECPPEDSSNGIVSTSRDTVNYPVVSGKRSEFVQLQMEDESLIETWELAKRKKNGFEVQDGLLIHLETVGGEKIQQVLLPKSKRQYVLKMAHEVSLAGHLGEQKTKQRIKYSFFWPNMKMDIKRFCESCKTCQLRRGTTYNDRVPIQPIVRPDNPFEVWSVDCIGPLEPPSSRGHKYIICAVDLCTRWAEAIPVKNISAKTTCDVLMKIFTQTGFPKTVCTDQGANFTSQLTKAFLNVLGVSPRFSTPGHPESMGAVERWNKTLKEMLGKNIEENGRQWDIHLPFLLFAYREVPHSTTGVSPYQLVYGRLPPGPLKLLKDVWTGEAEIPTGASPSVESYIGDLQKRIKSANEIATENAERSQGYYTSKYNLRTREKTFAVGDKVLILIPSSSHKLLKTWTGPATIIQLTRPHSALVELEDKSRRELHFNKLRPYIARVEQVGLIFEQDQDFGEIFCAPAQRMDASTSTIKKYVFETTRSLNEGQQHQLLQTLEVFREVFSARPGRAKIDGHSIKVTKDCVPRKIQPYRVPIALQTEVDRQIQELLEQGLIEESDSEWAHPVVCVAKRDGSVRLCVDYRALNSFTVSDAYPMKHSTELLYEIGSAPFISVLDLTKGYWQIPLEENAKPYSAFVTHSGHYQWNVMPFGLKNAGSTFQKSIDKIFKTHRKYCRAYIDDLAIFSNSWEDHLYHIKAVLGVLHTVGLKVNLKKCDFGKSQVRFLGHIVGSGKHAPDPQKIEAMQRLARPTTKKELRGIIGLASYYRDYIQDFSTIVLPLTNLTKKRVPNNIPWSAEEEASFQKLKQKLTEIPLLYTPVLDRPYQLYTDASATAVGACLAQQDDEGKERPIAFFSRKLTPCQTRWATIEREAYAVLSALSKFDTWVFGAQIQIVSDHNPLTYLTHRMPQGAKLARWALALQRYNLSITYRKGSKHGNADALSRIRLDDP